MSSPVTLHPLAVENAAEVLRFETENRAFFERSVAGFGDAYYTLDAVTRTVSERVQDWHDDAA